LKRDSIDEGTYELMKERHAMPRVPSALGVPSTTEPPASTTAAALSLGARAALLFAVGMGYGVLVSRLHDEPTFTQFPVEGLVNSRSDWRYLVFCGVSGVVLGGMLPLFDCLWEQTVEKRDSESASGTDWALVIRGIGAFAGIIFAIVSDASPRSPGVGFIRSRNLH
jgi:hypothetical protein